MLRFSNGTLFMRKLDVKEPPTSILSDIQTSYLNYVEHTVYEDVAYLEELLHTVKALEKVTLKVVGMDVRDYTDYADGVAKNVRNIPVVVDVYNDGKRIKSGWEIFKIPTMHDFGKFNFNGNLKSVVMQLRSSYDISYERKNEVLNISMPKANIRLVGSLKGIKIRSPRGNQPLFDIMLTMLRDAGDTTPINTYIRNARVLSALGYKDGFIEEFKIEDVHMHKMGTINLYASEQYNLGPCRNELNLAVGLERGMGYELAEPINGYKEGTIVNQEFIASMYRNRQVTYVVKTHEYPDKYIYRDRNYIFTEIPTGTQNCAKLREVFPQYAGFTIIPEDIKCTEEQLSALSFFDGKEMTCQDFEFLDAIGIREFLVSASKTAQPFNFSMVMEITGNYMAPLYKLTNSVPAGRDANEWVYYFNNPNLDPVCPMNLTGHDFVALSSLIGEIFATGHCRLLNRDTAFLKRVIMCGDIFSESLRQTMKDYLSNHRDFVARSILSSVSDFRMGDDNPFKGLNKDWYSYMMREKYLATVDTVNLSAEISQACHINTPVTGSQEILDEQRHLAIQYFGRICPFETPAGFKLGVVNSRAMGSRVRDGLLETAYHKVLKAGSGIRISKDVVWMTAKEELGHKFGDILSLKTDAKGNYINTKILARVPNPDLGEDPFIFKNINAFDLVNGYVNVYPEQFISPVVNLVPFACSTNPVRLSFGSSQIRQAINLVNSEKPLVVTPMYEQMFDFASNSQYVAEKAGTVVNIDGEGVTIQEDATGENYKVITKDKLMSKKKYRIMDQHVKRGDHVKKGEVIADGYVYPQDFVVRSPYNGFVSEINHDHIVLSKSNNMDAVDLEAHQVCTLPLQSFRQLGNNAVFLNLHVSVGDSVSKGQILADTCTSRGGYFSPSRNPLVCYWPNGYTYEDGVCATEKASISYISFLSAKAVHRVRLSAFKRAVIGKIDSFEYKEAGQVITRVKLFSDFTGVESDYSEKILATHKSHGILYKHSRCLEDKGKTAIFTAHLLSMNKLKPGDKMSGRHGNKGVVSSKVYKDSEALQLANGMTVDFILGPCGIPSRMNMGQIWELHASLIAKALSIQIDSPAFNGGSPEEIAMLMKYAYAVANNVPEETGPAQEAAFNAIASAFKDVPKELHDHVRQHLPEAVDWKGVFDERGCAKVYNPETGTWLDGDIIIGFPMFNKLMQEADEKLNVRSGPLEESYSRTASQPIDTIQSAKGQRMAEMEIVALAALGCSDTIREVLNEKSDNEGLRTNTLLKQLKERDDSFYINDESCSSRAVDNLIFLLEACGVKLEVPKEITDVSFKNSIKRTSLNIEKYIKNRFSVRYRTEDKQETKASFAEVKDE